MWKAAAAPRRLSLLSPLRRPSSFPTAAVPAAAKDPGLSPLVFSGYFSSKPPFRLMGRGLASRALAARGESIAVSDGEPPVAAAIKNPTPRIVYDEYNHERLPPGSPSKRAFAYFVLGLGRFAYASTVGLFYRQAGPEHVGHQGRARHGVARGRPVEHRAGQHRDRQVAREARLHPAPDGGGDRAGEPRGLDLAPGSPARLRASPGPGVARGRGRVHAPRLHPAAERRRLRRVVLPVPRLALRHLGPGPEGPCAAQSGGAGLRLPRREAAADRFSMS